MASEMRTRSLHHPPGAEVQVADLAVAHLPFGQSNGEPRRLEQRARRSRPEASQVGVRASAIALPSRSVR